MHLPFGEFLSLINCISEITHNPTVNFPAWKTPVSRMFIFDTFENVAMSLETIKINLAKQLFNVEEESVLMEIKSILDNQVVVAYTIKGKPLSVEEYNASLNEAEEDIKAGRTTDSSTLKEEVKQWRKS